MNTTESSLILTEPYFNLPNIQERYDQFVFEEYEFESYHRCTRMSIAFTSSVFHDIPSVLLSVPLAASLIPYGGLFAEPGLPPAECMLLVDSGFSYTHVVPILQGNIVWKAVKRLDDYPLTRMISSNARKQTGCRRKTVN